MEWPEPKKGGNVKAQIVFTVSLPFTVKKDGKYYVSSCPVLDVWSQGKTEKKAEENLKEAVQLFLMNCFERGTLEKVLKECGFVPAKKSPLEKQQFKSKQKINVPLPFIIDSQLA